jgi:hypothetical protein
MKFVIGILLGLFIGCEVHNRAERPAIADIKKPVATVTTLPREMEQQFDNYLAAKFAAGFFDDVIIVIVKRVLQALFLTALITLITDNPWIAGLVYITLAIVIPRIVNKLLDRNVRPEA